MPTTSDLRPKSTASEAREHDSCTMAEARACGWTPCGSYRARLLPLTLTLSPLREERNGERGRPHVDFRSGSKPAVALRDRRCRGLPGKRTCQRGSPDPRRPQGKQPFFLWVPKPRQDAPEDAGKPVAEIIARLMVSRRADWGSDGPGRVGNAPARPQQIRKFAAGARCPPYGVPPFSSSPSHSSLARPRWVRACRRRGGGRPPARRPAP